MENRFERDLDGGSSLGSLVDNALAQKRSPLKKMSAGLSTAPVPLVSYSVASHGASKQSTSRVFAYRSPKVSNFTGLMAIFDAAGQSSAVQNSRGERSSETQMDFEPDDAEWAKKIRNLKTRAGPRIRSNRAKHNLESISLQSILPVICRSELLEPPSGAGGTSDAVVSGKMTLSAGLTGD